MSLFVQNLQDKVAFSPQMEELLERVANLVLRLARVSLEAEVSLVLVDDQEIQRLNLEYRGVDAPTDVLSFAMQETGEEEPEILGVEPGLLLGDVIISLETAARQAEEYGHSLEREIGFLAVHGILHLLGYDHQDPEETKVMRQAEETVLADLGLHR
ncbi:MAG: rRNA maturation RNase YbeY [Bacillota bacterium]